MNIQSVPGSSTNYSPQVNGLDRDNDNDKVRPDNDGDDAGKTAQANAQKTKQTIQMEQSVQPNLGKSLNVYA